MLKINVLIITYNQEKVIARALDSILIQKDWGLNKIIICDDKSLDRNWEVIQEYYSKYPDIICAYRNEVNLGIYRNAENRNKLRGDADIYVRMAGDDALCDGYFEALQKFCKDKSKTIRESAVAIYSDWKMVDPNGRETIYNNSAISTDNSPLSLKIRGKITNRSVAVSEKLLRAFQPVDHSCGLCWAEIQFDIQTQLLSEMNYYCPFIGSIYFSGVGISTTLNTIPYYKQNIVKYNKMLETYSFVSKDVELIKHYLYFYKFLVYKKFSYLYNCRRSYVKSLNSFSEYRLIRALKSIYGMLRIAYSVKKES